jgi:hypothetical protein
MGAAVSLVAIAVGAILDFAVTVQNNHGFNINRIGVILMVVGIVGLIVSAIFWRSWAGFGGGRYRRTVTRSGSAATRYDANGNPIPEPATTISETRRGL